MTRRLLSVAAATLMACGTFAGTSASAAPPPPLDLSVVGGAETWHPANAFWIVWGNPSPAPSPPIAAVHHRVVDPLGKTIREERLGRVTRSINDLRVPDLPGAYTAEVWLEDAGGAMGPPAAVKLRFDDARPPSASPRQPARWIGRTDFPYALRIDLGPGAIPISGIRGYAVSVDRSPQEAPCAGPSHCESRGAGGASFTIDALPEGTSYAHVVAVSGSGTRSTEVGHATLRVDETDPETRLRGVPAGWVNHSVALTATAVDAGSGMKGGGAFTAIRIDGETPATSTGDSVEAAVIESGAHEIAYYARDAAGNVDDGGTVNGQRNEPPARALVRIDRTPPSVAFRGSLDPGNPELIEVRVVDPLSGPDPERGRIGVRRAGSNDRFEPLPVEAGAGQLRAEWDSEAHPPGEYEFEAVGYDAAGNATVSRHRLDGSRMVLSNPLKATTSLSAGFGGSRLIWHRCTRQRGERRCGREAVSPFERRPRLRVVPYGRGTLYSGRLTTGNGSPLEGAPVRIVERFGPGSTRSERVSRSRTRGDGRFSVRLSPGPSREIVAEFEGTRTLARAAAAPIRLAVRGKVLLGVSATTAAVGGRPVVFGGRVIAGDGEIPVDGKAVALQFRFRGSPWEEFRTVQTDRRGRFRYAYRFSDDDSRGIRFQFRAHAPAQGDWPYEPSSSRPVAVRGE